MFAWRFADFCKIRSSNNRKILDLKKCRLRTAVAPFRKTILETKIFWDDSRMECTRLIRKWREGKETCPPPIRPEPNVPGIRKSILMLAREFSSQRLRCSLARSHFRTEIIFTHTTALWNGIARRWPCDDYTNPLETNFRSKNVHCRNVFFYREEFCCRFLYFVSRFWTSVESPRCKSHILIGLAPQMLSQHKFIGVTATGFLWPCALIEKFRSDFLKPFGNHGWVERMRGRLCCSPPTRSGHPGQLHKSSRFRRF